MTTLRSLPRRTLAGLATLSAAAFIAVTTETLPTGLLPQIGASLHVSQAQAGSLIGVYALVVALGAVPLAILTNRLPRKALILSSIAGYAACCVLVTVTSSFAVALAARAVGGVAHALFFAVASAYATRLVPPHLVGRATAMIQIGGSLALVAGVPLGTAIGLATGWRTTFLIVAGVGLLLMVVATRLLPAVPSSDPVSWHVAIGSLRAPGLLAIGAVATVSFAGHYSVYTYITPVLHRGGIGESRLSLVLLLFGVGGLFGVWLSGMTADRRPGQALTLAFATLSCAMVAVWATADLPAGAVVAVVVWATAMSTTPTLVMTSALRAGRAHPDLAAAMVNSTCNIGIAGGSFAGGAVLTSSGLTGLPIMAGAFFVITFVLMLTNRRAFAIRPQLGAGRTAPAHQAAREPAAVSASSR